MAGRLALFRRMPTPTPQMNDVLAVLAQFPNGATVDQIEQTLTPSVPAKTVRFWLKTLLERNQVVSDGALPTPHYRLAKAASVVPTRPAGAKRNVAQPMAQVAVPRPTNPLQPAAETSRTSATPVAAAVAAAPTNEASSVGATASVPAPTAESPMAVPRVVPEAFLDLFDSCVFSIVIGRHAKNTATIYLQQQAMQCFDSMRERTWFVRYGLARLDALTLEEAENCGVLPEQFEPWKLDYSPTKETDQPAAPERSPTAAAAEPVAKETNTRSKVARAPHLPLTRGAMIKEAIDLAEPLELGNVWQQSLASLKLLITWRRVGIAVAWGMAVSIISRKVVLAAVARAAAKGTATKLVAITGPLSYLMIPAAGVAWLIFRWNDCRKTDAKLQAIDYVATLLLGGIISLMAGSTIASILDTVIAFAT